jgi:acetyltransferase-like isoleucine patch superfamily enzyme
MKILPELGGIIEQGTYYFNDTKSCSISKKSNVNPPYHLYNCKVGDYTYIAINSRISETEIGKFCSIGPNFFCGYGIHPANAVSTSPMFYSTLKQNGTTLSKKNKIEERKKINIGNDVFIGCNVTVLDGVTIGDGAIIGAGAVVSKDIPPYAIAVGCPIRIIKYRFDEKTIQRFLRLKWWNKDKDSLRLVEKFFFDPEKLLDVLEEN